MQVITGTAKQGGVAIVEKSSNCHASGYNSKIENDVPVMAKRISDKRENVQNCPEYIYMIESRDDLLYLNRSWLDSTHDVKGRTVEFMHSFIFRIQNDNQECVLSQPEKILNFSTDNFGEHVLEGKLAYRAELTKEVALQKCRVLQDATAYEKLMQCVYHVLIQPTSDKQTLFVKVKDAEQMLACMYLVYDKMPISLRSLLSASSVPMQGVTLAFTLPEMQESVGKYCFDLESGESNLLNNPKDVDLQVLLKSACFNTLLFHENMGKGVIPDVDGIERELNLSWNDTTKHYKFLTSLLWCWLAQQQHNWDLIPTTEYGNIISLFGELSRSCDIINVYLCAVMSLCKEKDIILTEGLQRLLLSKKTRLLNMSNRSRTEKSLLGWINSYLSWVMTKDLEFAKKQLIVIYQNKGVDVLNESLTQLFNEIEDKSLIVPFLCDFLGNNLAREIFPYEEPKSSNEKEQQNKEKSCKDFVWSKVTFPQILEYRSKCCKILVDVGNAKEEYTAILSDQRQYSKTCNAIFDNIENALWNMFDWSQIRTASGFQQYWNTYRNDAWQFACDDQNVKLYFPRDRYEKVEGELSKKFWSEFFPKLNEEWFWSQDGKYENATNFLCELKPLSGADEKVYKVYRDFAGCNRNLNIYTSYNETPRFFENIIRWFNHPQFPNISQKVREIYASIILDISVDYMSHTSEYQYISFYRSVSNNLRDKKNFFEFVVQNNLAFREPLPELSPIILEGEMRRLVHYEKLIDYYLVQIENRTAYKDSKSDGINYAALTNRAKNIKTKIKKAEKELMPKEDKEKSGIGKAIGSFFHKKKG